jgi:MFS family permease
VSSTHAEPGTSDELVTEHAGGVPRRMNAPGDATAARFPYPLVCALGVGQIVAWGSYYYVFVSLRDPMGAELGWTKAQIDGALSVVLAVTGLCSYARGRWVDRYGGRRMMTAGAFVGAALLVG